MSIELHADATSIEDAAVHETSGLEEPAPRTRPNVSGDLHAVLQAAPMFRRALAGYDRFQVDSYVQWAEDELTTADRQREHLLARQLETAAGLDEARSLLAHSADGGQFLQTSRRIGSLLATAADEADAMRAEAEAMRAKGEADRRSAADEAARVLAETRDREAATSAAAERVLADARDEAAVLVEQARRVVAAAEETCTRAQAEAAARLAGVRDQEQRAAEQAERTRDQALAQASIARLQARDDVVGMLTAGREERRRAAAEAASTRERLDRDAVRRTAALLQDVAALEARRAALRTDVDRLAGQVPVTPVIEQSTHPSRALLARLGWVSGIRNSVTLPQR